MMEPTQKTSAFLAMMGAAFLTTVQLARSTTTTPSSDTAECPFESAACFDADVCWDCMSGLVDIDDCEDRYPLAADEGATDCQVWGAMACCSLEMTAQDCLEDEITMDYIQCTLEETGCTFSDAPCADGSGGAGSSLTAVPIPAPSPTESPPTAPPTEPPLPTPPTGAPMIPLTDSSAPPRTPAPLEDAPLVWLTDAPINSPTPAPIAALSSSTGAPGPDSGNIDGTTGAPTTPSPVAGEPTSSTIEATRVPISSWSSSYSTSNERDFGPTPSPTDGAAGDPPEAGPTTTANLNRAVGTVHFSSIALGAWTATIGVLVVVGMLGM